MLRRCFRFASQATERFPGHVTVVETESDIAPALATIAAHDIVGFGVFTRPREWGFRPFPSIITVTTGDDAAYVFRLTALAGSHNQLFHALLTVPAPIKSCCQWSEHVCDLVEMHRSTVPNVNGFVDPATLHAQRRGGLELPVDLLGTRVLGVTTLAHRYASELLVPIQSALTWDEVALTEKHLQYLTCHSWLSLRILRKLCDEFSESATAFRGVGQTPRLKDLLKGMEAPMLAPEERAAYIRPIPGRRLTSMPPKRPSGPLPRRDRGTLLERDFLFRKAVAGGAKPKP